jgi:hypothetical protein
MRFFSKQVIILIIVIAVFSIGVPVIVNIYKESSQSSSSESSLKTEISAAKNKVIGTSVLGRQIEAYTYGTGKTNILFVGGMHGGYEWNSVVLAYSFIDYLNVHPEIIPQNLSVTVIPSINPDGVFKVVGKEGRFTALDVPANVPSEPGRFNAHGVDLNRNFDCKWNPEGIWKGTPVSTGTAAFSEPESRVIRDFILANHPAAAVFWHSQANAVYASECEFGIIPETLDIMGAYATAAGYPAVKSFDAYVVTGDAEGWLASIGVPAITVELKTHETIEWDRNLAGIMALLKYYSLK